jgi:hypothetical protein
VKGVVCSSVPCIFKSSYEFFSERWNIDESDLADNLEKSNAVLSPICGKKDKGIIP